jgi:uncharacterized DUF497 family protein
VALQFLWDVHKARANIRKHGISFDEAATVFRDGLAAIFDDEDHSTEESCEIIIGHSAAGHLLVVSFTETAESTVRIISARVAAKRERLNYERKKDNG